MPEIEARKIEMPKTPEKESRGLVFQPNCEMPGQFESEKEMGDLVVEAKQAKENEQPLVIEEKKESEFDPKAIDTAVRQKIKAIVDGPLVDRFFSEMHPDDLDQVQKILSKQGTMGAPKTRLMSNVIGRQVKEKATLAQRKQRMEKAALEERIKVVNRELLQLIESEITRMDLFGTSSHDKEIIIPRDRQLYNTRINKGADYYTSDIISHLIGKEKEKIKKETAEEGAEVKPEEVAVEIKEEAEGPQPWLDQEREKMAREVLETLATLEKEGGSEAVRQWFVETINPLLEKFGEEPLSPEDIDGLFYVSVKSESASRIAGQEITRPVFMFKTAEQYKKFITKLSGQKEAKIGGVHIPAEGFPAESPVAQIGMIIENGSKQSMDHEIRHSIDPYVGSRQGADDTIIAEAFAYYKDLIEDKGDWQSYRRLIRHKEYFSLKASRAVEGAKENFDFLVGSIVNSIRRISQREGHLETQRIIAQCKNTQELLSQVNK